MTYRIVSIIALLTLLGGCASNSNYDLGARLRRAGEAAQSLDRNTARDLDKDIITPTQPQRCRTVRRAGGGYDTECF